MKKSDSTLNSNTKSDFLRFVLNLFFIFCLIFIIANCTTQNKKSIIDNSKVEEELNKEDFGMFYFHFDIKVPMQNLEDTYAVYYKDTSELNHFKDLVKGDKFSELKGSYFNFEEDNLALFKTSNPLTSPEFSNFKIYNQIVSIREDTIIGIVKDVISVKFKEGVSDNQKNSIITNALSKFKAKQNGEPLKHKGYPELIDFSVNKNQIEIANAIQQSGFTLFSHPNFIVKKFYHSGNCEDTENIVDTHHSYLNTKYVFQNHTKGINTAKIFFMDKSFYPDQVEINVNFDPISIGTTYSSSSSINDNLNKHGTQVVGLAVAKDGVGCITGVCPNCGWDAKKGVGSDTLAWYLNNVLRYSDFSIYCTSYEYYVETPNYINAVNNISVDGRNGLGIIPIFSAGNNGTQEDDQFTARSQNNAICVGGLINGAIVDNTTNYGPYLDVVASSILLASTSYHFNSTIGTYANDEVGFINGTSAACPQIAGMAGLLLSKNPQLTREEVYHLITKSANNNIQVASGAEIQLDIDGFHERIGFGSADAKKSFEALAACDFNKTSNLKYDLDVVLGSVYGLTSAKWESDSFENDSEGITFTFGPSFSEVFTAKFQDIEIISNGVHTIDFELKDNQGNTFNRQVQFNTN